MFIYGTLIIWHVGGNRGQSAVYQTTGAATRGFDVLLLMSTETKLALGASKIIYSLAGEVIYKHRN